MPKSIEMVLGTYYATCSCAPALFCVYSPSLHHRIGRDARSPSCSYVKEMASKFHLGTGCPMVGQHVIVWILEPGKRFREASSRDAFHVIGTLSNNITPGKAWERRSSQGVEVTTTFIPSMFPRDQPVVAF